MKQKHSIQVTRSRLTRFNLNNKKKTKCWLLVFGVSKKINLNEFYCHELLHLIWIFTILLPFISPHWTLEWLLPTFGSTFELNFTPHPFSHLTHSSAATLLISRPSPSQTRTQRITTEASARSWTPRKKAKQQQESQKCRNVQGQLLKTERKALLGLRSRSCWHHNIEPIVQFFPGFTEWWDLLCGEAPRGRGYSW